MKRKITIGLNILDENNYVLSYQKLEKNEEGEFELVEKFNKALPNEKALEKLNEVIKWQTDI